MSEHLLDMAQRWVDTGELETCSQIQRVLPEFGYTIDSVQERWTLREDFRRRFGFAVPCLEALQAIEKRSSRILEVGAGTGFWSAILAHRGVDVIATDSHEKRWPFRHGSYHPVRRMGAEKAISRFPDRDVLLVWPSYAEPWAGLALRLMRSGRWLFYVGEGYDGCTGDQFMHHVISEEFVLHEEVCIPQFDGLHDYLQMGLRK